MTLRVSVIKNPKPHSKGTFKHYGQWQEANGGKEPSFQQRLKDQIDACLAGQPDSFEDFLRRMAEAGFEVKHGRGGAVSFRAPVYGQTRFTRLRSSTLGDGYGPEELRAAIEAGGPLPGGGSPRRSAGSSGGVNLLIDIQRRMAEGKGPGYERWAKLFNLKQMAATLQYLQENDLLAYADLERRASDAAGRFRKVGDRIKKLEAEQAVNGELRSAVVNYAKNRPVFEQYKAQKYSNKYLADHEGEIALYRSAAETFRRLLDGGKLPRMDALRAEASDLAAKKKAAYAEYRAARKEMQDVLSAKGNIDHLLGVTDSPKNKEMLR